MAAVATENLTIPAVLIPLPVPQVVDPSKIVQLFKNHAPLAPLPKEKCCKNPWKVVIYIVILPLGVLWTIQWLFAKLLLALFAQSLVRYAILPATSFEYDNSRDGHINNFFADLNNRATRLKMTTSDGVELDGSIQWSASSWEKHRNGNFDFSQSKWVICYNGNGMNYKDSLSTVVTRESYQDQVRNPKRKVTSPDLDFNVLRFNYRGVEVSGMKNGKKVMPTCSRDLIIDGVTPIQVLEKMGVPQKHIFLEGMSLGGGISVEAAVYHPNVNVGNVHSFTNITACLQGILYTNFSACLCRCLAKVLAYILSAIAGWLISNANWNIDAETNWSKITGYKRTDTATEDKLMIKGLGALATGKIGTTVPFTKELTSIEKGKTYTREYPGSHMDWHWDTHMRRLYFSRVLNQLAAPAA